MDGSEPLNPPTDLIDALGGGAKNVNFSLSIIIFFLFLFVSSNMFIHQILSKFEDTTKDGQLTVKAVVIQGIVLSLLFICIQFALNTDLL